MATGSVTGPEAVVYDASLQREERRHARWIAGGYLIVASIYIWVSDPLVGWLVPEPRFMVAVQVVKGTLFVFVTAALLYIFLRRAFARVALAHAEVERGRRLVESLVGRTEAGVVLLDRVGRVNVWNGMAEELLGWRGDELVGRPFPLIDREGDSCPLGSFVRNVLRGDPGGEASLDVLDRVGRTRSLRVRVESVDRADADRVAAVIVLEPATARQATPVRA